MREKADWLTEGVTLSGVLARTVLYADTLWRVPQRAPKV